MTRHAETCKRVFANYDPTCPRCAELSNGAAPRAGWGDQKRKAEEARLRAIKAHRCTPERCGPVCTAFDW